LRPAVALLNEGGNRAGLKQDLLGGNMKILVRNTVALGVFFILALVTVQAQTERGQVNIPFDFYAGTAKLKAGDYQVKRMSDNAVAIRSADGKTVLVNAPLTIGARDSKSGRRLVFNRYGDRFFISQIWLDVDSGRQVIPSKEEIRIAKDERLANGAAPQRREVALR